MTYDPNGNIKGLKRTNSTGVLSDDFSSYRYQANTNKLTSVGNNANPAAYATYAYDDLGQLKSETKTGAPFAYNLKYDVTGKITGIYADAALTQLKVAYYYDESGNRIARVDYTGTTPQTTYTVFDAGGNPMAIYNNTTLSEVPIYGSERLGTYSPTFNVYAYELRDNVGSVRGSDRQYQDRQRPGQRVHLQRLLPLRQFGSKRGRSLPVRIPGRLRGQGPYHWFQQL